MESKNALSNGINEDDLFSSRIPISKLRVFFKQKEIDLHNKYDEHFKKPFIYHYLEFHVQTKRMASRIITALGILFISGILLYNIDPDLIFVTLMSSPVVLVSGSLRMPQIYVVDGNGTVNDQIDEAIAQGADEIHFDFLFNPGIFFNSNSIGKSSSGEGGRKCFSRMVSFSRCWMKMEGGGSPDIT